MTRKTTITILAAGALCASLSGCRSHNSGNSEGAISSAPVRIEASPIGGQASYMPKARIYRTNGDYNNYVPITVNADRTAVTSFPAPTDLTERSKPIALADGWLLDRRGIGTSSVFTDYTYADYMALNHAPSPEELLRHIIPGAEITEIAELPILSSKAFSDPDICLPYINDGLRDCRIIKK